MRHNRYSVILVDSARGEQPLGRLSVRTAFVAGACVCALPVLVGLGARWSAGDEIDQLRGANHILQLENNSYRAATGELTTQITSLQSVIDELGDRARIDPGAAASMARLPGGTRSRAMGGAAPPSKVETTRTLFSALTTPETTFGALRELLGTLENRLQFVRTDVERRKALADATPAVWPALGWLTAGYGGRRDPITGAPDTHLGLDIAADEGAPVYATGDGVVESAAYSGDYGNALVVAHEFGLSTKYAHLSGFAVRAGSNVRRGDVIGYVGATGRATGTHLHYEVWANGRPINPLELLVKSPRR